LLLVVQFIRFSVPDLSAEVLVTFACSRMAVILSLSPLPVLASHLQQA